MEDDNEERDMTLFSDKEMMDLASDEGKEGLTSFNAAMLVNVKSNIEGVQTELYDSGASWHMSPYCDHFKNYISIAPKLITAADKRYFQAIGKGNLWIKIPNETITTTIKNILHCPDMGLTLILIGKITATGYKVIFRDTICRIYNQKDKVISQIRARNGLYHVDHGITVNIAMTGEARKVLTIEELHCHMGHITPEMAKQMVSNRAIDVIEIDSALTIQHCKSCKYPKATQKLIKKACEAPRAPKFGHEIHSDVWGPSPVQTPGHKEYYVSFTDNYTQWTHIWLLAMKDRVFQAYQDFEAWAKLHFGIQGFKFLQSDWGGEYLGKEFSTYLSSQGTEWKLTVHNTPEYNGVSECLNQTLLEWTCALLHLSKLPKTLWREAITHIFWLKK